MKGYQSYTFLLRLGLCIILLPLLARGFVENSYRVQRAKPFALNLFDKLSNAFSKAFENDPELIEDEKKTVYKSGRKAGYTKKLRDKDLVGTEWTLRLLLQGIPAKDPSTDLFAPKSSPGKVALL